jgi:rod shape-determining protein MreC
MKIGIPRFWQTVVLLLFAGGLIALGLSGYLNPVFSTAFGPFISVQRWISTRYSAVVEFVTVPRDMATLRQENAALQQEVASLQTRIVGLEQQLREAQVLYALLDFRRAHPENEYVACAVIGKDPSPFLQYILIDHGSDDGIRHGMPVVTEKGLVGRVDAVTSRASRVQLITDVGSVVNAHLESNPTDLVVKGSITGDLTLEMVPQDIVLKPGELVLTSGLGGNYPADILIGQVINIRKRETDLFQSASVQPIVDFSNLPAVLVITNFKSVDILPLIPETNP